MLFYENENEWRDKVETARLRDARVEPLLFEDKLREARRRNPIDPVNPKMPIKDQIWDRLRERYVHIKPSIEELMMERGSEIYQMFSNDELKYIINSDVPVNRGIRSDEATLRKPPVPQDDKNTMVDLYKFSVND